MHVFPLDDHDDYFLVTHIFLLLDLLCLNFTSWEEQVRFYKLTVLFANSLLRCQSRRILSLVMSSNLFQLKFILPPSKKGAAKYKQRQLKESCWQGQRGEPFCEPGKYLGTYGTGYLPTYAANSFILRPLFIRICFT